MYDWQALVDHVVNLRLRGEPIEEDERISLVTFFELAIQEVDGPASDLFTVVLRSLKRNQKSPIDLPIVDLVFNHSLDVYCTSRALLLGATCDKYHVSYFIDLICNCLTTCDYLAALQGLLIVFALVNRGAKLSAVEKRFLQQAEAFLIAMFEATEDNAGLGRLTWLQLLQTQIVDLT
jgi:hypothetical protein